ncbi:MAG: DUF3775 domain-containing protein [Pseudomonadota bacterium]|nr:DUF3775 domain-containing protein [Pseudomonadota bacterium]
MLEISPAKVAHVIVKAREYDAKVGAWEGARGVSGDNDSDSILEGLKNDPTRREVSSFIAGLNVDEQVHLVALMWVGRGTFSEDEFVEAVETARLERSTRTHDYLLGIPLLADYLEEGLEKLGISIESAEEDIL